MLSTTLKSLLSRKVRLLLSGIAVLLGVMAVSGALILSETLEQSFDTLFQTVNANIDVQVTGPQTVAAGAGAPAAAGSVPASVVARVAAVPGVRSATGTVFVNGARVVGTDGRVIPSQGPPRFGTAWHGEDGLVELRQGRGPTAPDEVAINSSLARAGRFHLNSRIEVLTLQPKLPFTVVGIFGYSGGRDSIGGETRVAFTEPVAQELMLGRQDVFSAINVKAADGVPQDTLRAAISGAIGDNYVVRTRQQVADDEAAGSTAFLSVFRSVLLGFAGIALFVGIFLILNTFFILVAQRTHELALLRLLGASRGQLVVSVVVEALVVGLVASTLGLLAGVGVAALLRTVVERFSGTSLPGSLQVPGSAVVAAYLVGTTVTVVAALLPAVRASRVRPMAAIREAVAPDKPLIAITVAGALPALAGMLALGAALFGNLGDNVLWTLLAGVLLLFVGVAMLTPAITRPVVLALGRPLSLTVAGKLGCRNAARNPRRTAITAAALMVGVALVSGISVVSSSLTASYAQQIKLDLRADLIINGESGGRSLATFDPTVIDRVRQLPDVTAAIATYTDTVQFGKDTQLQYVTAGDVAAIADLFTVKRRTGELRNLRRAEAVVDADLAKQKHISVGDTIELATHRGGRQRFGVVGVFEPSQILPGLLLSGDDGRAYFQSPQATQGYIKLREGANMDAVQRQVQALLRDDPEVTVGNQKGYIQQQAGLVNTFQVIVSILLGLSVVIAVLGIVNTLVLSVVERTRELGLVRAVGMRRLQVAGMVAIESIVIAAFGALLGLGVGSGLGAAVVSALREQGVSVLSFSWATTAVFLALTVIVGLGAAVLPAVRAARVDVLRAIAYE
jgi:putative ABC transport system permease protein